jgi:IclR family transcriptional regulator, KDG regulon repressor
LTSEQSEIIIYLVMWDTVPYFDGERENMPADSTKVLSHIIKILDCFSVSNPEMGVRQVARLAEISSSTAGRLMNELKDTGILQQNPASREYSLGSKVLGWSSVYMAQLNIRTVALPFMEDLRRTTGETVTLYILDGNDRLCVERMESQHNIRMVTRVGNRLPLYAGSAGKAILAFLPGERQEEYLQTALFKPLTNRTIVDPQALREELGKIRQDGFATSFGEWLLEASGVAAPIFGPGGVVSGALSISGPAARFNDGLVLEYAHAVLGVTRQISQSMGYIP